MVGFLFCNNARHIKGGWRRGLARTRSWQNMGFTDITILPGGDLRLVFKTRGFHRDHWSQDYNIWWSGLAYTHPSITKMTISACVWIQSQGFFAFAIGRDHNQICQFDWYSHLETNARLILILDESDWHELTYLITGMAFGWRFVALTKSACWKKFQRRYHIAG